jgi:hypothetical protein
VAEWRRSINGPTVGRVVPEGGGQVNPSGGVQVNPSVLPSTCRETNGEMHNVRLIIVKVVASARQCSSISSSSSYG